jgi:transposase
LAGESKYQIAFSFGMHDTDTIRKWVKDYETYGWAGLKTDGNAKKYFNVKVTIRTKLKQAEEEISFLRNKVKELDIEVEYLKKLIALVSQRRDRQI